MPLGGYDPFGAAAQAGYGIDPFEVEARNQLEDRVRAYSPVGQMDRVKTVKRAWEADEPQRQHFNAALVQMQRNPGMHISQALRATDENLGDMIVGAATGLRDDIQAAGDINERGDNRWQADVEDVGKLAVGFIPGMRFRRQGLRGSDTRAWHASPHEFDEFDIRKLGTGEGAQVYGQGLYFAGHRPVAEDYLRQFDANALKHWNDYLSPQRIAAMKAFDEANPGLRLVGNDRARYDWLNDNFQTLTPDEKAEWYQLSDREVRTRLGDQEHLPRAQLYEVDIQAGPDELLDFDRPLIEQPQRVQDAMVGLGASPELAPAYQWVDYAGQPLAPRVGRRQPLYLARNDKAGTYGVLQPSMNGERYGYDVVSSDHRTKLGWVETPEEGMDMLARLRDPLPAATPVTGSKAYYDIANTNLRDYIAGGREMPLQLQQLMDAHGGKGAERWIGAQLADKGIPGHYYDDQFTRHGRNMTDDPTHNYVIYDDDAVNIVDRITAGARDLR